jgi:hypothetical protein
MKKDPTEIARQIISLVTELAQLAGARTGNGKTSPTSSIPAKKIKAGPVAGIRSLIQDGKLDSPRTSAEIVELLKQEGRHYPSESVLMCLLRLVRDRILTRLKEKGEKNWKYAIRR